MLDVLDSPVTRFAQEAERRRIARELHDGVVQSLTALVADLEYFRTRHLFSSGEASQEVAEKLETWQELARDSLASMRQALGGLRKQTDFDLDLESAIQALVDELRAAGYCVVYECEDCPTVLPFEYTSNLYYIIREALTNIRKHAQAAKIHIFMFIHDNGLHVSIGDDGVGMAPRPAHASVQNGYCQGLIGLRERAALLGGRLSIESVPGKGTRLDIDVPLRWD